MEISDKGYENIMNVVERIGLNIEVDFIKVNLEQIASNWPKADDADYLADREEGDEVYWTFEAEVNGGGISDTCQRELLADVLANILVGKSWPCYGDKSEVQDAFFAEIKPFMKED